MYKMSMRVIRPAPVSPVRLAAVSPVRPAPVSSLRPAAVRPVRPAAASPVWPAPVNPVILAVDSKCVTTERQTDVFCFHTFHFALQYISMKFQETQVNCKSRGLYK